MIKITFESATGARQEIEANPGESLMIAAVRNRVKGIEAACGGSLVCGTCHVFVSEPWFSALPEMRADERLMLDYGVETAETSRLACQIPVTAALDGALVRTPIAQI